MHKILVVDDEKSTLGMFHLFLSAYGYTVLTAENGTEGLQLFEKEKPPIVITDIKMPGVDGIELLRRIKEMDEMTEVIMITGHGDMELAVKINRFRGRLSMLPSKELNIGFSLPERRKKTKSICEQKRM
jgi:DNA-binding NtrC family response regulator